MRYLLDVPAEGDMTTHCFKFLDGRKYKLDGITGTFQYRHYWARYPGRRYVQTLVHEKDANGRRTKAYQERRRQLGDDWVTDLTDGDRFIEIALELGWDPDASTND